MVENTCDPVWGGDFHWELTADGAPQDYRLRCVVKDRDKIGCDDALGSVELTLKHVFDDDWLSEPVRSDKPSSCPKPWVKLPPNGDRCGRSTGCPTRKGMSTRMRPQPDPDGRTCSATSTSS